MSYKRFNKKSISILMSLTRVFIVRFFAEKMKLFSFELEHKIASQTRIDLLPNVIRQAVN